MLCQNESEKLQWFKNQLKLIEIEVFSYCNRRCWFCPNSFIDRHSSNNIMPENVYLKILYDLQKIEYDQEITYSRYNEPLSHKEIILERISQARHLLPDVKLRTNTNGDYIDYNYILELRDSGLNELFIQQYLGNNELYDHEKMKQKMLTKLDKLNIEYSLITDIVDQRIEYKLHIPNILVHLRARNFSIEGSARTDMVKKQNKPYHRTHPCIQPFHNMYIDYNGKVMVCCNTRSDINSHEDGVMGSVLENNLWHIYSSHKYDKWRDHLKDFSPKSGICKECKIDIDYKEFIK